MGKKRDGSARNDDLQLLALIAAKRLRDEHSDETPPSTTDFRIVESETFFQAGAEVQVDVALGRGVSVRIYDAWWKDRVRDLESLVRTAESFADKIAHVRGEASDTRAMVSEVGAAARREVSKGKRCGLAYALTSLELLPILASGTDDTAVRVEHQALGRSLRPEPFAFHAESAEDVTSSFAGIAEEQGRRASRRRELDKIGATGTIDSVVVAALAAAGLELPPLLARLRDADDWIVDVKAEGDTGFRLHWNNGAVWSQVQLAEGVRWNEGTLWMDDAPRAMNRLAAGSPLSKVFEHPFLDERLRVHSGNGSKGEKAMIRCSEAMLNFDADTGRLWPA